MTTASEVQEIIYDFTQRCFIGEDIKEKFNLSKQNLLFKFLETGDLTVEQVHLMSENHQKILRELLSQYILFLQMNQHLEFPDGFLQNSGKMKLGSGLLEYICHYKWPFPQLLEQHGAINA
ncbi:hypothetical protein EZJ19_07955 [Parasulfuritortus cantonensis]|uniref:Uncharacterized protein n=1 Tax=Parasulfuritortus cantonensis TaxID=2528202 RepID=A0A4V2NVX9_9PROT|nr:hypothetical protein [Parasulfuritortus cantonensis]TCJ15232.1 hypothetical protein EZJ19_07955 [Parasulfuritortus cantonensis]